MRVNKHCAECLWDKQLHKSDDPEYLDEVRRIIESRSENDSAPYLVYLFNLEYEQRFGKAEPYKEIKQAYNDFVFTLEEEIRKRISLSHDPLASSLAYARIGNYIDFGAMNHVDRSVFLSLLDNAALHDWDIPPLTSF